MEAFHLLVCLAGWVFYRPAAWLNPSICWGQSTLCTEDRWRERVGHLLALGASPNQMDSVGWFVY